MPNLVDTHCHIHFKDYGLPIEKVLADSAAAGVDRMILVGCTLADSRSAAEFAAEHDNVWVSVGAHPHDGADFLTDDDAASKLAELAKRPKVIAIGEIGLDYYHENASKQDQAKSLRAQIEVGLKTDLPFIFHVRDAFKDFWPIFDEYDIKNGVIHSFSAGPKVLDQALRRGLYIGLNGIMTFTRDESQLAAARAVPLDRLLLETDAPFLTPKPHRGEICEPKHVRDTAEFLAELREQTLGEIAEASSANAERLFNLR
ncbi:MAG TPA: TatD family hydrolase [Candidatus Saccharimonadales bacterium]|nr:TatD family hydrolase [Candidatus Saccharimonadales bacterium]